MAERRVRQAIALGKRSTGMTIPSEFAAELNIKPKTQLVIEKVGRTLVISNFEEMELKPKAGKAE